MIKVKFIEILRQTEKALLLGLEGGECWIPKSAIYKTSYSESYILLDDWLENSFNEKEISFEKVSLAQMLGQANPPKIEYTTDISGFEFPETQIKVQDEAVRWACALRIGLLWLWTGAGKTKIALDIFAVLEAQGLVDKLVYLTPPRGIEQVRASFIKFGYDTLLSKVNVLSINHLSINEDFEGIVFDGRTMLVIDEAHKIKNSFEVAASKSSHLAKNLRNLCDRARYVYGMTATPIPNRMLDLAGIFNVLKPDLLDLTEKKDIKNFCKIGQGGRIVEVKNPIKMCEDLGAYVFFRNKADFDSRTSITRDMPIYYEHKDIEKFIELFKLDNQDKFKKPPLFKILGNLKRNLFKIFDEPQESPKYMALVECLESIALEDQVILFNHLVNDEMAELNISKMALRECNISFVELHGSMSDKDKAVAIDAFRKDEYRVLLTTYGTGSTMLDFPNANHCIFFGHTYNAVDKVQGQGRIERLIQTKQTYIYNIYVANLFENLLIKNFDKKMKFDNELKEAMKSLDNKRIEALLRGENEN